MHLKNFLFSIFLLVFLCDPGFAQYDSIFHSSLYRTYKLHVPASYVSGSPTPLIIAMHGGFGSGTQLETQSLLSIKSNSAGFIVVYPEGVKSPANIRTWNAGGCCGYAASNNIDDVGFITALIDSLRAAYTIDTLRIFATGMSNGAFMSYRLACERSQRIASIAPVAGSMNVSTCNPVRGVPVIHFHSYQDASVPYLGGVGAGVSNHWNPPTDSVLNVWAGNSSCTVLNDTLYNGNDYTYVRWNSCNCGNEMKLYITQDGGHSWPGGTATPTGDPASTVINANNLMWTFFQQHPLPCNPTAVEGNLASTDKLRIYPNPTSGKIHLVSGNKNTWEHSLEIYNTLGKKIHEFKAGLEIIDLSHLPDGVYFLKTNGNASVLIKQ